MNARFVAPKREIGYRGTHRTNASGRCENNPMLNSLVQESASASVTRLEKRPSLDWPGLRLAESGNWTSAMRCANRLLSRYPDHLGALEVRVRAQLQFGEYESALLTLRRLIRLNSAESGYEILRASAMQSMGRLEEAVLALQRARSLCRDPKTCAHIDSDIQMLVACLGVSQTGRTVTDVTGQRVSAIPLVH